MKTVLIYRFWSDQKQTLGNCVVLDELGKPLFSSIELERGWLNNAPSVSSIPVGSYPLKLEYSPRFKKDLWEIYNVPGRSECKFHAANYWRQLNGCIALGLKLKDIDFDGYMDITDSATTMDRFHHAMGSDKEACLIIKNV